LPGLTGQSCARERHLFKEVQVLFGQTYTGPVAERNCVTARWGGEQREAKGSSVAKANSIRPR
jgi:hypothetical protein